jgi:ankyrin repeat protein
MALSSGNAHVGVAFMKPCLCPNKCGQIVLQRDFDSHVHHTCLMREVLCPEGCGNLVLGKDMRSHAKVCIMVTLCERAEVAVRERALKELKLVMAELYAERERAAARHVSHNGAMSLRGWATLALAVRVGKIEAAMKELVMRCRRKSKDNLVQALSTAADGGKSAQAGPQSAFKQLDKLGDVQRARGARPWDIEANGLEGLLDALEEASICGGNEKQRLDCEAATLSILKRMLQAALDMKDRSTLEEIGNDVAIAVKLIELSNIGDIPALLREVRTALHHAALADVPAEETSLEFFDAVKKGDTEVVQWLLDREQVNPTCVDPRSSFPAIIIAARSGDIGMCDLLISRRADVNARCEIDGFSALHWSTHMRFARVMNKLLAGGANPRLKDKKGQDPLMKLVRRDLNAPAAGCAWSWEMQHHRRLPGPALPGSGVMDLEDAKVAAEAIPHCVGISFRSAGIGHTPSGYVHFSLCGPASMVAAPTPKRKSKSRTVQEAEAPGGDADTEKKAGEEEENDEDDEDEEDEEDDDECLWTTYLRIATNPAHDVIAMLAAGADATAVDCGGLSALHHHLLSAPSRGSYDVVAALLRAQADVNIVDSTPRSTTPLLLVVGAKRADLLKLMLTDAWPLADVDARTSDGLSAMALAEERGARDVIELLRGAGASVWTQAEARFGAEWQSSIFCDTRVPVGAEA